METRRISIAVPTDVAEGLAAMSVRSGVKPSEIVVEALREFSAFQPFSTPRPPLAATPSPAPR